MVHSLPRKIPSGPPTPTQPSRILSRSACNSVGGKTGVSLHVRSTYTKPKLRPPYIVPDLFPLECSGRLLLRSHLIGPAYERKTCDLYSSSSSSSSSSCGGGRSCSSGSSSGRIGCCCCCCLAFSSREEAVFLALCGLPSPLPGDAAAEKGALLFAAFDVRGNACSA